MRPHTDHDEHAEGKRIVTKLEFAEETRHALVLVPCHRHWPAGAAATPMVNHFQVRYQTKFKMSPRERP